MKHKVIIYISILGLIATIILSNIEEIQNKEYVDGDTQQANDQLEGDEAVTLFKYLPTDW